MAPELFNKRRYDESVDVWAMGIVIYQLLTLEKQDEVPDLRIEILNNPEYIFEELGVRQEKLLSRGWMSVNLTDSKYIFSVQIRQKNSRSRVLLL